MSIEPSCHYCGLKTSQSCKTLYESDNCGIKTDELGYDFGFSFTDDLEDTNRKVSELNNKSESDSRKIEILKAKLDELYNTVVPFLNNLCKNPEKTTIHWPNRVEKIEEFKNKLKRIKEIEGNK